MGVHRRLAEGGTTIVFSTHNVAEAEHYADRVLVLGDGELLFTGTPAELERGGGPVGRGTSSRRLSASCTSADTEMRWLLIKDLQILKRSPLLVALLVVYPIAIALMIGLALSAAPTAPRWRCSTRCRPGADVDDRGSQKIDLAAYANELFQSIDPVTGALAGRGDPEGPLGPARRR